MDTELVARIANNPNYQALKAKRTRFGWWLTLVMMIAYYGFILLVAFNKSFLSQKLGAGVMTMGIPIGFGVIVFTIVITAYYVNRANREFDALVRRYCQRVAEMIGLHRKYLHAVRSGLTVAALFAVAASVYAAGPDDGQAQKQAINWTAICMFGVFVLLTLFITKWAAARTKSAADFYTAGGGITGFQNGLAIAGDYMSAASFLGISAAVMASGYDGLIYSIGFLVGWPVITFLMAERLRNLGKFTFADVAAFRFKQAPIRIFAASGTLVVVAFYLIAQMVGAGQLIKLLFGLEYWIAVVIVGGLMMVYVLFGGMTATTWVQIIKACHVAGRRNLHGFHGAAEFRLQPGGDVCQSGRDQSRPGHSCGRASRRKRRLPVSRSWDRAISSRTRSRRSRSAWR